MIFSLGVANLNNCEEANLILDQCQAGAEDCRKLPLSADWGERQGQKLWQEFAL